MIIQGVVFEMRSEMNEFDSHILALLKQLPERPEQGFEPWPLQFQCSALPVELSGQLGCEVRWMNLKVCISISNPFINVIYLHIHRLIINPHNNLLPVGLIAQLVEHCTGITEVTGSINALSGLTFSGPSCYCFSSALMQRSNLFICCYHYDPHHHCPW